MSAVAAVGRGDRPATAARAASRRAALPTAGIALILLLAGSLLPLWAMVLHAPQYTNGLRLIVDGGGIHGDVDEINALNHYIGMSVITADQFPEAALFYPAVVAIALGLVLVPFVPWRVFRWLVVFGSWALPLVFLAALQYHLYVFGHSLNPEAAFRLPAFTPRAVGPTVVMNFNVTAWPGIGLMLLLASACVLTWGPRLATRLRRLATARAAAAGLVAAGVVATAAGGALAAHRLASPPSGAAAFDLERAVAVAAPHAVIEVPPGHYRGPIVLRRPVTLRAQPGAVIDGQRRGNVVVIAGDDVTLEGFVIRGSALAFSSEASGVVVSGARAVVRANWIEDVLFGIYLAGAHGALIEGNRVSTADLPMERRGHAIYLWRVQGSRLVGNTVLRGKDGIYVSFSDDNVVERNTVTGSRYGIHYMYAHRNVFRANAFLDNVVGAAVMYSTDVTLDGNTFAGSRSMAAGAGLIFKDADRLLVRGNRVVRNRFGMEFENTPASIDSWVRVERNVVAFNDVGFSLMSTAAITATENVIIENLRAVQSRGVVRAGVNRWAVAGRGNHWGDYAGFDAAGDGIGDIAYRRTDLLEGLADRTPALQAFLFTPAHLALELAARVMPLVRAAPVVEDPSPLMRPPAEAAAAWMPAGDPTAGPPDAGLRWVGVALLVPAVAGVLAIRSPRRDL
ncbi:MAG: nitrous oxide reductase family maturation protein NosD [Armatimonadota bacterium]|nr:nitrous oxide reductase family maturation protein NosD [Armatimonadota bacterium]